MHRASDIPELVSSLTLGLAVVKKIIRQAWRRAFGEKCQSCGSRMLFEIKYRKHRHFATIDHIIARALGGSDTLDNIQVICRECNTDKSKIEYRQSPNC